ncbi:histone deacetylase family protein [Pseudoalteromonas denitrificans]|uniref:Acetoin utilization deacetylase AcuC n=1 Tax=Pseudoalteromonas denitrificans DSM 6059 TaxID=1123010 RepID=A0A1I1L7L5_9GAMM|nr:histone deacetylase family protein [Pseudoalteromonas denitrificans]SFC69019.1 Acetoin utilization deacetylase AcuC [Pseudoalteromonas denitrificans DSM 6059]
MRTAIIYHPDCRKHKMTPDHPESTMRLDAIQDRLLASGLDIAVPQLLTPKATDEDILRVHKKVYVDFVKNKIPKAGLIDLDGDTWLCKDSFKAAERAAGSGIYAVEQILSGQLDSAFCAIRPPGHHANEDVSSGFCIFNNVAIAVKYAQEQGIKRIAILDIDVHHGNGTQDIFEQDDNVLFCSIFQHPFYPNTPIKNTKTIINTPLKAGLGGDDFKRSITDSWLPAINRFSPELIVISAGFDGHLEDDMGQLVLVEADYAWFTDKIVKLSKEINCKGIVSMLEGGYDLSSLGRSVAVHIKSLAEV